MTPKKTVIITAVRTITLPDLFRVLSVGSFRACISSSSREKVAGKLGHQGPPAPARAVVAVSRRCSAAMPRGGRATGPRLDQTLFLSKISGLSILGDQSSSGLQPRRGVRAASIALVARKI